MKKTAEETTQLLASIPFETLQSEFKRRRRLDILERLIAREQERQGKSSDKVKEARAEIAALKAGRKYEVS